MFKQRFQTNSVIMPLIGINVVFFILQMILPEFTTFFILDPKTILYKPFTLITSMFLHGSMNHIFFNMYGLMIFGQLLENRIGWKQFLFIYMLAGILAAIGHSVFELSGASSLICNMVGGRGCNIIHSALGASGAIMGMLGTLIILMPELRLLFFFFIPMSLRTAGIIWIVMDLFGLLNSSNGIGNVAHLVGIFCGLIFGLYLKKSKKKYYRKFHHKGHITIEEAEDYSRYGRI
jgi:uncharacterized protein